MRRASRAKILDGFFECVDSLRPGPWDSFIVSTVIAYIWFTICAPKLIYLALLFPILVLAFYLLGFSMAASDIPLFGRPEWSLARRVVAWSGLIVLKLCFFLLVYSPMIAETIHILHRTTG
jgi:hypothetical protein